MRTQDGDALIGSRLAALFPQGAFVPMPGSTSGQSNWEQALKATRRALFSALWSVVGGTPLVFSGEGFWVKTTRDENGKRLRVYQIRLTYRSGPFALLGRPAPGARIHFTSGKVQATQGIGLLRFKTPNGPLLAIDEDEDGETIRATPFQEDRVACATLQEVLPLSPHWERDLGLQCKMWGLRFRVGNAFNNNDLVLPLPPDVVIDIVLPTFEMETWGGPVSAPPSLPPPIWYKAELIVFKLLRFLLKLPGGRVVEVANRPLPWDLHATHWDERERLVAFKIEWRGPPLLSIHAASNVLDWMCEIPVNEGPKRTAHGFRRVANSDGFLGRWGQAILLESSEDVYDASDDTVGKFSRDEANRRWNIRHNHIQPWRFLLTDVDGFSHQPEGVVLHWLMSRWDGPRVKIAIPAILQGGGAHSGPSHTADLQLENVLAEFFEGEYPVPDSLVERDKSVAISKLEHETCANLVEAILASCGARSTDVSFTAQQWWASVEPKVQGKHRRYDLTSKLPPLAMDFRVRSTYKGKRFLFTGAKALGDGVGFALRHLKEAPFALLSPGPRMRDAEAIAAARTSDNKHFYGVAHLSGVRKGHRLWHQSLQELVPTAWLEFTLVRRLRSGEEEWYESLPEGESVQIRIQALALEDNALDYRSLPASSTRFTPRSVSTFLVNCFQLFCGIQDEGGPANSMSRRWRWWWTESGTNPACLVCVQWMTACLIVLEDIKPKPNWRAFVANMRGHKRAFFGVEPRPSVEFADVGSLGQRVTLSDLPTIVDTHEAAYTARARAVRGGHIGRLRSVSTTNSRGEAFDLGSMVWEFESRFSGFLLEIPVLIRKA